MDELPVGLGKTSLCTRYLWHRRLAKFAEPNRASEKPLEAASYEAIAETRQKEVFGHHHRNRPTKCSSGHGYGK